MSAMTPSSEEQARYSIGVFSRLTGISPGTLRIWERRYKIVSPIRSGARGERMYTQSDVDRFTLIKALVDRGHPVSTLAQQPIDELRSRLKMSAEKASSGPLGTSIRSRVVVLGDALAIRLTEQKHQLKGIEICGIFRSAAELDDQARALTPDVLLVEYATLQRKTLSDIWRHLAVTGVRHAVVVFGFGARRTVEELERAGVFCLQAPASLVEIESACASARGASVQTLGHMTTRADAIPPRRFSPEQLARIATSVTAIQCECPRHLVDLVNSLVAFETYSSECANLYPRDVEIHGQLYATTAAARAMLEAALATVIEEERIRLD